MHSWLRDLVAAVAISAFIIIFLYQPVRVEGTSMLPMLEDQDRLFINKIAYRMGEIHRAMWWYSSIHATTPRATSSASLRCLAIRCASIMGGFM